MNNLNYTNQSQTISTQRSISYSPLIATMTISALMTLPIVATEPPEESITQNETITRPNISYTYDNSYTSKFLNQLTENLDKIGLLENNWNNNNAVKFSEYLIDKTKQFISYLEVISPYISVFPTACNSIQIEYISRQGIYCEAEIFEDTIDIFAEKNGLDLFEEEYSELVKAASRFKDIYKISV